MNQFKNLTKGFIKENPVLVLFLGLCPTLGVTTTAMNGLGMGLATTFVLLGSNIVVSLIKNFIPDKVRIPSYIVIIATFVTVVELVMKAYAPELGKQLGVFIPLIVVNCIVLGRAEAFASKNNTLTAAIDGLGMGLGFATALFILGGIRQILGAGIKVDTSFMDTASHTMFTLFGAMKKTLNGGALVFILAPGAFLALGYLIAITKKINEKFNK